MKSTRPTRFAICLKNKDCEDLVLRKIYPVLPDEKAEKVKYIRVIDESGEDYLYPKRFFLSVTLPQSIRKAVLKAA